eukprot:9103295-Ditylum_brightwellii.AAC.1
MKKDECVQAKSRIVVLGNLEQRSWEKYDVYAPVITQTQVHLLTALAVLHNNVLKQANCKNAFCHGLLPEDETISVCPPPGCPHSKPAFKAIGLQSCPNAPCLFHGELLPGHPPIYVGLYVDNFVYFLPSPEVKKLLNSASPNNKSVWTSWTKFDCFL